MRTITTDKGKTYEAIYCWAPCMDGSCGIEIRDSRPIAAIVPEFDGLTHIHLIDPSTGEYDFDGYTVLNSIGRTGQNVQIKLRKGDNENTGV